VRPGDPPSWSAATSFFSAYLASVWPALVAALLISAAVRALLPAGWLPRLLNRRRRWSSALVGGLLSTPSMMCTCCSAPVAVTLRRRGVGLSATVACWLGNPLLNPAVLVFLLLVAPWPWALTRGVVGAVTVFVGAVLVARWAERGARSATPSARRLPEPLARRLPEPLARRLPDPLARRLAVVRRPVLARRPLDPVARRLPDPVVDAETPDRTEPVNALVRFVRTLAGLSCVLVPEYLGMVLLVGAFRGWLFPLGATAASWGALAVLLATVVGTLVVPTAAEIPTCRGWHCSGGPRV
jgi:uncharacterized protein